MPNHCENKLTVYGPEEEVAEFVTKARGKGPKWPLSPLQKKFGEKEREPQETDFCFHALYPVPDHIIAAGFSDAGYNWCSGNWGTKWGAYDIRETDYRDEAVTYKFTTAWAPPVEFLKKVSADFPKLHFALSFSEEFPSRGRYLFWNGTLLHKFNESCPLEWNDEADEEEESQRFHDWQYRLYEDHEQWVFGELDSNHIYGRFSDLEMYSAEQIAKGLVGALKELGE